MTAQWGPVPEPEHPGVVGRIGELDAAWAEVEAALPDSWWFELFCSPVVAGDENPFTGHPVLFPPPDEPYVAEAARKWTSEDGAKATGPTPAAALRALAARLRERAA